MPKNKSRLDKLLVERDLVESREKGRRFIMAGEVRVNGQVVDKAGTLIANDAEIELTARPRFVSRGGDKLMAAMEAWQPELTNKVCADFGSSTGGFTDCMLQHGAAKVYAVDVGKGILHWKLRSDDRVVVMESTNARYIESLPDLIDLLTIDASFISLELLLPAAASVLTAETGQIYALIKPQFEAGKEAVGRGGVVRNPKLRKLAIQKVLDVVEKQGLAATGLIESPLKGPAGNIEYLVRITQQAHNHQGAKLLRNLTSI